MRTLVYQWNNSFIPLVVEGEDWRIVVDAWIPPEGQRLPDIVIELPVSSIKCSKQKYMY